MLNNKAFWKALHSLTHPFSVAAILLLLFNDHWLRHNYPSLLTGKLGDFTWLLFAPFIAALLFAFLIPPKIKHHTKIVGLASIAFIGIWFATAKTIPFFHWLTTETLYAIVGYRGTLRMDLTDLLTLPALLLSWYIWQQSVETKVNLKPVAYVAFGLAMLGTMASDDPIYFNTAIESICETDNGFLFTQYYTGVQSYSHNYYNIDEFETYQPTTYVSRNGGLTWQYHEGAIESSRCSNVSHNRAIDPNNSDIQYRWQAEQYIEKSTNRGASWSRIDNLSVLQQDIRDYGNRDPDFSYYSSETMARYLESPVSGIVHSETGNLVLAMSADGVLVIMSDGHSTWVTVGDYQLDDLQDISLIGDGLETQKFLLPTLWFLILVTTITIIHSRREFTRMWLIIGWIHWGLLVVLAHKVFDYWFGGSSPLTTIALFWALSAIFSLVFNAFPMSVWGSWNLLTRYGRAVLPISVTVILASGAYMLPLLLWTQGTIPRYYVAAIFSLLLTGCVLWACYTHFKDKLPARYVPPKEKRKPKEV